MGLYKIEDEAENFGLAKLKRKYSRDEWEGNELVRIFYIQDVRSVSPNVCLTVTDYNLGWRPAKWQSKSHLDRFRKRLCRFLKRLFKALCGPKSGPDDWPQFYVMVETISKDTGRQVMPHASIALCLTEKQKIALGAALGKGHDINARAIWLEIIGAHKRAPNDTKAEGFRQEEKHGKLFYLDHSPSDNLIHYITKFSGIENNANYSIKKSDLLCVIGRQKRKSH